MNILIFHPVNLPPKDYGGVERVVLWLSKGLVERGHQVFVAALRGSQVPKGVRLLEVDPEKKSAHELLKPGVLPKNIDLVHFMAPPEKGVIEGIGCPSLLTVHGNGKPGERYPKNSVFLSQDHARRHGGTSYVYNGIDPEEFLFQPEKKNDSFLFLANTGWKVKNLKGAIELCVRANTSLQVAGGWRPYELWAKSYFQRRVHWVGPVAGMEKAKLLARSKALLFPILWPEPFGLVVVESLISGTPVLASRTGSMPELIANNTGALLDIGDSDAWLDAMRDASKIDPSHCREEALKRFHYRIMAEGYEVLYKKLIGGQTLHEHEPSGESDQPWR